MPMQPPRVTVLISTFNRPDYLKEAIRSVVDQSLTDWELLVMNDGGVDVTHIVESFNDPRIRYFPDRINRGLPYRLNFGLAEASGRYITYLGDDDLFYPNHCQLLAQALDENPDIAVAYSDLYAVTFIKDERNGRRYVLDKRMSVSRDFNRQFMFYFNHTLHVSLMHRKEAALRVGGYDPDVTVLIDWNLTRKLCFIYDFIHVPAPTGEYYMPIFKSDRISIVERKDKEKFKHNTRRIKGHMPEEPWPRVRKIDVIFPVRQWDQSVADKLADMIDNFHYPVRFVLVNNGSGLSTSECRAALGRLADLANISIHTSIRELSDAEAYAFGARMSSADFFLLASERFQAQAVDKRILLGMDHLQSCQCDGIRWQVEEEQETPFNLLIRREAFFDEAGLGMVRPGTIIHTLESTPPSGFLFDYLLGETRRRQSKGEHEEAYRIIHLAMQIRRGVPGIQFMAKFLVEACLETGRLTEAENACRSLIERGYSPDNWLRLGRVLQAGRRYPEAVAAYLQGLKGLNLNTADLDSPVFPFNFPKELASFTSMIGLGECHYELGNMTEAAHWYRRAAKLRANSHRPFLGFAKLFLASNQLDRAEAALTRVGERDGKDPETHRVLGKLCERRKRMDLAFGCYLKAFQYGQADEKNIDPFYFAGANLERWAEMQPVLETFLEQRPSHLQAIIRLASVYFQLGEFERAGETARRGLEIDGSNTALHRLIKRSEPADRP
ncbi:MAG: glycosyltransferase [Proteobacteria bacterium]|nr:glycosyltransferase [Pseudomonadota bacterium]